MKIGQRRPFLADRRPTPRTAEEHLDAMRTHLAKALDAGYLYSQIKTEYTGLAPWQVYREMKTDWRATQAGDAVKDHRSWAQLHALMALAEMRAATPTSALPTRPVAARAVSRPPAQGG